MQLILVRHAEPSRGTCLFGTTDPGLSERGERQAALLGAYLADEHVDAVYASPMRRAHRTAELVARALGKHVVVHDDLVEFDHGADEYIPAEDAKDDPRYDRVLQDDLSDWGVDTAEFQKRVVGAVDRISTAHRGETVVVVCHGGVLNAYLAHVLETRRVMFFSAPYTSVHRVLVATNGIRSITALNELAHLRGHDLTG